MNHRRLRLPAAMALMALAAPVLAGDGGAGLKADTQSTSAAVQREARDLGNSVRDSSRELNHQLARRVHEFRHEFTVHWYRTSDSIHRWWNSARERIARS